MTWPFWLYHDRYDVLDVGEWDTTSGSVQILKLRRKGEEVRKQHMQLVCKRHSKRKDQHAPYGERHRSIVVRGVYPQGVQL